MAPETPPAIAVIILARGLRMDNKI